MIFGSFIRRATFPVILAGPVFIGLPPGAGIAAAGGALVGLALVLPLAIALRVLPLRSLFGWPLMLLRVFLRR
ncbi:hypothetical protein LGQ03_11640 [Loktanella sp. TSTF-M6]|uniref:Uncharacterized protein n=1 Tax=Loktanella gaetbuli TaxID=2881335 RepID=A0ABS8BVZ4_9RHOB|nr:hypothetical protein [Loktanella gaetbuli]MCB5199890.1 hypothetical protein [Loktanella gaetbuli]